MHETNIICQLLYFNKNAYFFNFSCENILFLNWEIMSVV